MLSPYSKSSLALHWSLLQIVRHFGHGNKVYILVVEQAESVYKKWKAISESVYKKWKAISETKKRNLSLYFSWSSVLYISVECTSCNEKTTIMCLLFPLLINLVGFFPPNDYFIQFDTQIDKLFSYPSPFPRLSTILDSILSAAFSISTLALHWSLLLFLVV